MLHYVCKQADYLQEMIKYMARVTIYHCLYSTTVIFLIITKKTIIILNHFCGYILRFNNVVSILSFS